MNAIRAVIIDDEYLAREEMKRSLAAYPFVEVVGEAAHVEEAATQIALLKPDLIFLDIQMPGKSGFDLLEELTFQPEVIFTTAYDQYAVKAFEVNALDYLLKPIRQERLDTALERVREHWTGPVTFERRVFIKDKERCYFLAWAEVYLIESMGNYARLYTDNEKAYLKRSIHLLEQHLDPDLFFRINRTQIINKTCITHMNTLSKGRLEIHLHTGSPLQVSSRQSVVLKRTGRFLSVLLCCLLACARTFCQDNDTSGYIIQDSILIEAHDGTPLSVLVARKRGVNKPLPAILEFTVYAREQDYITVVDAASRGYVGVMGYTRGKRYSKGFVEPYEHDGADADAVIEWIARQPWCDGRVGMYGGSYNGFTQWAAAKHLPRALKTIVPSTPVAPGRDAPMSGGVVMSFPFSWTYYVSNKPFLDTNEYFNTRWGALYQQWFSLGTSYRTMDTLTGKGPNRIFRRWLAHPLYDKYWQDMIPYKNEFSAIPIPVLYTTGYYDGCQPSALYYYREHQRYYPGAEDYLLIGPYGHFGAQGHPDSVYNRYTIDPVANIPIHDIIFQWFDYILKNGPKPALLKDRINYEVMGTNTWSHVPTLSAMATDTLNLYLSKAPASASVALVSTMNNLVYRLSPDKPGPQGFHTQTVDFKDRTTVNSYYYEGNVVYDTVNVSNSVAFVSDPLPAPVELNGNFFGELHVSINKRDMDYSVNLFECRPDGTLFFLSYFMARASDANDIEKRVLLQPGKETTLPINNSYMTAKRLERGSRVVILVNVNKSPFEQINYGTGKDVNDETIKDAGAPLQVKWYCDSHIGIPIHR